jgi:hypothetical protein
MSFWSDDPGITIGDVLDGSIDAISTEEFWEVASTGSGKLALTWDSDSDIASLTNNDLTQLVVAAFHIDDNEWRQLPATATGNFTAGTLETDDPLDYSKYSHFTFARAGVCRPILDHSNIITTWNGSTWSHGVPTIYDRAILDSPFTGSITCYSLEMNADLTLTSGQVLDLMTGVTATNNAKVVMASTASIMQRDENATPPQIELTKTTAPVIQKRYVYWGTPIVENFFSQIAGATAQNQTENSNAFDLKWRYVSGTTQNTGGWQTLTATEHGKGFIARVAPQAPFVDESFTERIDMTISGTAGNGVVDVPVAALEAYPFNVRSHNLLANPYPSAIDGAAFLRANASKIDGVLYVWNSTVGLSTNGDYSQSDYSAWTLAGDNTVAGFTPFNGIIPSAQGFKVRVLDYSPTATVEFNNCMRIAGNGENDNFYRVDGSLVNYSQENENSFKVLMTSEGGVSSAFLATFNDEYTSAYDFMYDAYSFTVSTASVYATFGANNARLAINALPAFHPSDVVPMGVRKTGTTEQLFSFKAIQPKGVFSEGQNIYLFDHLTGIYHDILNGEVTLPLSETMTNGRFEIRFETPLSNPDFDYQNIDFVTWYQEESIHLKANVVMKNLKVYDLMGRLIMDNNTLNDKTFQVAFPHPHTAYFVKVTTASGVVLTQKLIVKPE